MFCVRTSCKFNYIHTIATWQLKGIFIICHFFWNYDYWVITCNQNRSCSETGLNCVLLRLLVGKQVCISVWFWLHVMRRSRLTTCIHHLLLPFLLLTALLVAMQCQHTCWTTPWLNLIYGPVWKASWENSWIVLWQAELDPRQIWYIPVARR